MIRELPGTKVVFNVDGFRYTASLHGFPVGTSFLLGGATTNSDDEAQVDLSELIAREAPAKGIHADYKVDPHFDIELRVLGHSPLRVPVPGERGRRHIVDAFEAATVNHPGALPVRRRRRRPRARGLHTILFTGGPEVFGPAATLRDVDWVAVSEDLIARKGPTCIFKADTDGGAPQKAELRLVDQEVIVV